MAREAPKRRIPRRTKEPPQDAAPPPPLSTSSPASSASEEAPSTGSSSSNGAAPAPAPRRSDGSSSDGGSGPFRRRMSSVSTNEGNLRHRESLQALELEGTLLEGDEEGGDMLPEPKKDGIRVVVRVRPLNSNERERRDVQILECLDDQQTLALHPPVAGAPAGATPKPLTFNAVLDPACSQEQVFQTCGVKDLLDSAFDGYSCTAFAFGQTGSGKTHTITGPDQQDAGRPAEGGGLIQRAMQYLFDKASSSKDVITTFTAEYIEIYREQVLDLLNPLSGRGALPVRWKADRGFYVENLFVVECETLDDMLAVLEEGLRNRKTAAHQMNERSSRSHSILTLHINTELVSSPDDAEGHPVPLQRHGQISFVDLAGSERVKLTKSEGQTLLESNNINKSLLTLGNCISALGDPRKRGGHIPYRESTLTMLLKDSLGGTGMTLMIACVSPSNFSYQETSNTLRYASRAKRIQNKPLLRMDPQQQLIIALKREVRMLRSECAYLRSQVDGSAGAKVMEGARLADVAGDSKEVEELRKRLAMDTRLHSAASDRSDINTIGPIARELIQAKVMLQQYMQENEDMRMENVFLYQQQQSFQRQHEDVMHDNEKLMGVVRNLQAQLEGRGEQVDTSRLLPTRQRFLPNISPLKSFDKSDSVLKREIISGQLEKSLIESGGDAFDPFSGAEVASLHSDGPGRPRAGTHSRTPAAGVGAATKGYSRQQTNYTRPTAVRGGLGKQTSVSPAQAKSTRSTSHYSSGSDSPTDDAQPSRFRHPHTHPRRTIRDRPPGGDEKFVRSYSKHPTKIQSTKRRGSIAHMQAPEMSRIGNRRSTDSLWSFDNHSGSNSAKKSPSPARSSKRGGANGAAREKNSPRPLSNLSTASGDSGQASYNAALRQQLGNLDAEIMAARREVGAK